MYSVAVCDDNLTEMNILSQYLKKSFNLINKKILLKTYNSGTQMLNSKVSFDIVFLDILLGDNVDNGITIAKKLKRDNPDLVVVLVSNSRDFLQDGYSAKATRYLIKPINFRKFHKDICEIVDDLEFNKKRLYVPSINSFIFLHQIYAVEKVNRKICIYTSFDVLEEYGTFDEWVRKIDDSSFSICSKGIYINLRFVRTINGTSVELINNKIFPVSRRLKRLFKESWYNYIGDSI